MAFVNEYISPEDREKYGIDELNKRGGGHTGASDQWTIDRERNIWLRLFAKHMDHTDYGASPGQDWDFYWRGSLMVAVVNTVNIDRLSQTERRVHKKLLKLNIPYELNGERENILRDLEEAFITYKDGGIFSKMIRYELTFEVAKGI